MVTWHIFSSPCLLFPWIGTRAVCENPGDWKFQILEKSVLQPLSNTPRPLKLYLNKMASISTNVCFKYMYVCICKYIYSNFEKLRIDDIWKTKRLNGPNIEIRGVWIDKISYVPFSLCVINTLGNWYLCIYCLLQVFVKNELNICFPYARYKLNIKQVALA